MRLLALLLGLGGLTGTWWVWWAISRHIPLTFRWWIELYVEPYVILLSVILVSIVTWEEFRRWVGHGRN